MQALGLYFDLQEMSNKGFKIEFEKEGEKPAAFESQKNLKHIEENSTKTKAAFQIFKIYKMV